MTGGLLTIDLAAVAENYRRLRSRVSPACEVAAVLKADAYGLGAAQVSPALTNAGVGTFFVALPEEGERLRAFVPPEATIYILSGPVVSPWEGGAVGLEVFQRANLRPVLSTPQQVAAWVGAGLSDHPFALQVESGMNRLGMDSADVMALPDTLKPALVMSHLACADDPKHPQNAEQLGRFRALREKFPGVPASLAASAGTLLGADYHFDMVRPGIALYGGNPQPSEPSPVSPVVTLEVTIVQVRRVDLAGAVGYGATHSVTPGTRLATVAAGYADGLLRALSGRGYGLLAGHRVPLVGRVSMDLISFDVSAVPEAEAQTGRSITLISGEKGLELESVAAAAGTISYEVLTSLGQRYARRYVNPV